jgi:hypothetical protein
MCQSLARTKVPDKWILITDDHLTLVFVSAFLVLYELTSAHLFKKIQLRVHLLAAEDHFEPTHNGRSYPRPETGRPEG